MKKKTIWGKIFSFLIFDEPLPENLYTFLKKYPILKPFVITIRAVLSWVFMVVICAGVFYVIPKGIYLGLTLLFPAINFVFIIVKALHIFMAYGIVLILYYVSKFFWQDHFGNNESVGNLQKWFLIIATIVCAFFVGIGLGHSHTVAEFLNSSTKYETENRLIIVLILTIPILVALMNTITDINVKDKPRNR